MIKRYPDGSILVSGDGAVVPERGAAGVDGSGVAAMNTGAPRFLNTQKEPVRYRQVVDMLADNDRLEFPEPNIRKSLFQMRKQFVMLQQLGGVWSSVPEVYLCLTEPDRTDDREVIEQVSALLPAGRLPMASGHFMVDCDGSLAGPVVIHFFDERFLTIGILLHELAHVLVPSSSHDLEFYRALHKLEVQWYGLVNAEKMLTSLPTALFYSGFSLIREKIAATYRGLR